MTLSESTVLPELPCDGLVAPEGASGGAPESRRERNAARNRAEILDAAELVFREHAFFGSTMELVARRAEFSVGAIYRFFPTKDALFCEMLARKLYKFQVGVEACFDERDSALVIFERLFWLRLGNFAKHPAFMQFMFHELYALGEDARKSLLAEIAVHYGKYRRLLHDTVIRGLEAGDLLPADASRIANGYEFMARSYLAELVRRYVGGTPADRARDDEEARWIFGMFVRGVSTPEGVARWEAARATMNLTPAPAPELPGGVANLPEGSNPAATAAAAEKFEPLPGTEYTVHVPMAAPPKGGPRPT